MPAPFPAAFGQDEINAWFPETMSPPAPGTFEIALVLGGTVSAGIYTAGVLDYLLEALDEWEAAKAADRQRGGPPTVPAHNVVLRIITGASGGAINAVVFSRILAYASKRGLDPDNPLYRVWNEISITNMLGDDLDDKGFFSLLSASRIEVIAGVMSKWGSAAGRFPADPGPARPWASDKLRVVATVTNVTGFPYVVPMNDQYQSHSMISMADWLRLVVAVPGGTPDSRNWTRDEISIDRARDADWDIAARLCLATSAFPGAFPARELNRDESFAGYHFALTPGLEAVADPHNPAGPPLYPAISAEFRQLIPVWTRMMAGQTRPSLKTLNVDGGACNNEPLDIARIALAGGAARSRRDGRVADRATILIDPFSEPVKLGPVAAGNPLAQLLGLFGGLKNQARYKAEDIALANDESCFSRFIIAPVGPGADPARPGLSDAVRVAPAPRLSAAAIASGGFSGFGGFFCQQFVDYDFRLGRANARGFLKKHFMLPANNALYDNRWPANVPAAVAADLGWVETVTENGAPVTYHAIIPLMATLADAPVPGFLPQIAVDRLRMIQDLIGRRLDWIVARVTDAIKDGAQDAGWKRALIGPVIGTIWKLARGFVIGKVQVKIETSLKESGLL